jgi:hypothetical protein
MLVTCVGDEKYRSPRRSGGYTSELDDVNTLTYTASEQAKELLKLFHTVGGRQ